MRTLRLTMILLLSVVIFSTENANAQTQKSIEQIFESYFILKEGLVASDFKKAQLEAQSLANKISNVDKQLFTQEQQAIWIKHVSLITEQCNSIVKTKDIKAQRKVFVKLSESMYELSKSFKYSATIYVQKCPMFNNGNGATWLSKETDIKNPYYGAQMLSCGKTIETIK